MSSVAIAKHRTTPSEPPPFPQDAACSRCFSAECIAGNRARCFNSTSANSCRHLPSTQFRQKRGTCWDSNGDDERRDSAAWGNQNISESSSKRSRLATSALQDTRYQKQIEGRGSTSGRLARCNNPLTISTRCSMFQDNLCSSVDGESNGNGMEVGDGIFTQSTSLNVSGCEGISNNEYVSGIMCCDKSEHRSTNSFEGKVSREVLHRMNAKPVSETRNAHEDTHASPFTQAGSENQLSLFKNDRERCDFISMWMNEILNTMQNAQSMGEAQEKLSTALSGLLSRIEGAANDSIASSLSDLRQSAITSAEIHRHLQQEKKSWESTMKTLNEQLVAVRRENEAKNEEMKRLHIQLADSKSSLAQLEEAVNSYLRMCNMTVPSHCGLSERPPPDIC